MLAALHGLVLAGGESRRMGRDKSRLSWDGAEQRLRGADLLAKVCGDVAISVRVAEEISGYTTLVDELPGIGPMAGLLAAFSYRPDSAWLVLACDLPLMNEEALQLLIAARDPRLHATCFTAGDNRPEPLAAIWEPAAATLLRQACSAGAYGLQALLIPERVKLVAPPSPECLLNTNTPPDWDKARSLARIS